MAACGNHQEKAAKGHRIRFPQLRHFPQVCVFLVPFAFWRRIERKFCARMVYKRRFPAWSTPSMADFSCLCLRRQLRFGSPAARPTLQDMAVMKEAVEHGGNGGRIAQEFSPVFNRSIGS